MGRTWIASARTALTRPDLRLVVIDRGFLDGTWLSEQARLGTDIIIGLTEDTHAPTDRIGLSRLPDTVGEDGPPPTNHRNPPPRRPLTLVPPIESWDACPIPLTGLVVRDPSPNGAVVYPADGSPRTFPDAASFSQEQRRRWDDAECSMALARYGNVNGLPPLRLGVAPALVHFALVAYLLLSLFRWQSPGEGPLAS